MIRWIYILLFKFLCLSFSAYADFISKSDTITQLKFLEPATQLNKSRLYSISGIWAASYGSSIYMLSNYWYDNLQGFRTFDDRNNWLQVDKMGHVHTAYFQGAWGAQLFKWAGLDHKPATLIGGSVGFVNQTVIEILDGQSPSYGWSNSDFLANALGSIFFIGQELQWQEQRILLKFSYKRPDYKKYQIPRIYNAAIQEFGNGGEAFFKDYNAQTYWISTNIYSFLPKDSKYPKWLNVAVGFGADQMFHATSNENIGITGIERRREFYLSLDVDFTKIKTNNRLAKTALFLLNVFKVPFPALRFTSDGEINVVPF